MSAGHNVAAQSLITPGKVGRTRLPSLGRVFPSSAQGFIQGHQVGRDGPVALDQGVFRGIERPLGVQDAQEVRLALGVELGGQVHRLAVGRHGVNQGFASDLFVGRGDADAGRG